MTGLALSTSDVTASSAAVGHRLPAQRGSGPHRSELQQAPTGLALVVDPDRSALDAMRTSLIGARAATDVIAFTDADAALASVGEQGPGGLALVAARLGTDAPSLITALRAAGWRRILGVLSARSSDTAWTMINAGATGLVATRNPGSLSDESYYSTPELSQREVDVIRMVADGRPNKWIGEQLGLSALTVKSHLARIGRKLGTGDRSHIVMRALRAGVIS